MIRQLFLVALLIGNVSLSAHAASCRAVSAAQVGAQAGYERDRKAAEAWSQRENQVSGGLQQCLGSISTAITVPTFGDLSGILNGIKDKVCRAVRDKIQSYIPSKIDPWGDLSSQTGGLVTTRSMNAAPTYTPTTYSQPAPVAPTSAGNGGGNSDGYIFSR
ncbi:hypothetical protein ACTVKN_21790 [Serratia marcescens]|uniref:hypothetical protein n=1 Tax=Serratia marcescens TaxID=615 RepID=UPI003FA70DF5